MPSLASLASNGASLSIVVPAGTTYTELQSITLSVMHGNDPDLDLYLVSPNNTIFVLSTDNGGGWGSKANYSNTIFSDAGASGIASGSPPFTGTYKPEGQTFASYVGPYIGTWTLYACDDAAGTVGQLTNFSIGLVALADNTLALHKMVINNTSATGVKINNDLSISSTGALTLTDGELILNGNKLTIYNTATAAVTGGKATSYIVSEMNAAVNTSIINWVMGSTTGAHVYPFGVGGKYIPFTFNKLTAGDVDISVSTRSTGSNNTPFAGASDVAAVVNLNSPDLGAAAASSTVMDRWWDVIKSGPVTADITFTYKGSENTMLAKYQTKDVQMQHWNGEAWEAPVGSGTGVTGAGTGTVTLLGVSAFSPWVAMSGGGSGARPLPIELLSFTGTNDGAMNTLEWATASETNNNYFTLEKSADQRSFEAFAKVDGQGNSTTIRRYAAVDETPYVGYTYYRLKQTDFDGKYTYSKIIAMQSKSVSVTRVSDVRPNPTNDKLSFDFDTELDGNVNIRIYDYAGKVVLYDTQPVKSGKTLLTSELTRLSNGMYFIQVFFDKQSDFTFFDRIIKN